MWIGHGPVIRNQALDKINEYIEHRRLRENQIIAILTEKYDIYKKKHPEASDNKADHISSWEFVDRMYPKLSIFVKFSAQRNVSHHLEKLQEENVVELKFPDLWRLKK